MRYDRLIMLLWMTSIFLVGLAGCGGEMPTAPSESREMPEIPFYPLDGLWTTPWYVFSTSLLTIFDRTDLNSRLRNPAEQV